MESSNIIEKTNEIYWINKLKNLRSGKIYTTDNSNYIRNCKQVNHALDSGLFELLSVRSKGNELSQYVIILTTLKLLFFKHRNESPFVFSALPAESGIPKDEMFCLNAHFKSDNTLLSCLKEVQNEFFEAKKYADVDIENTIEKFKALHPSQIEFLFDLGISLNDEKKIALHERGVKTHFSINLNAARPQLTISVQRPENKELLDNLAIQFFKVLSELLNNSGSLLNNLSLVDDKELQSLQNIGQGQKGSLSKSIVKLFEEQVLSSPDQIAVVYGDISISYWQLNERSNQLATYLKNERSIKVGDKIGTLLSRSHRNIISMMAIMKLGAIYVPLDDQLPESRLQMIVEEVNPGVIITEDIVTQRSGVLLSQTLNYDLLDLEEQSTANPEISFSLENLSYIIHTSGSTGKPKGIMQTHKTLANLSEWQAKYTDINGDLKFLQYASFLFDVSIQDFACILTTGGQLHICSEAIRLDFTALRDYIVSNEIEALFFPFSVFSNFFQINDLEDFEGHRLRHLITGSEQVLIGEGIKRFLLKYPDVQLHNQYGPSETHVVTSHTISGKDNSIPRHLPIGQPISNTGIHIVDADEQLLPVGVIGEIYVSGSNLATGYWNLKAQTESGFSNLQLPGNNEKRVYKTGDKARWLPDGIIEYLGRSDDQVKIQGYRIELGEIITALLCDSTILEAVVITAEDQNRSFLIGYFISEEKKSVESIRSDLARILPQYMIPTYIVQIDSFPLTSNGKLDKKKLMQSTNLTSHNKENYVEPECETEKIIVGIWELELGHKKIGTEDNFFSLGGDSILAIRVISLINKTLESNVEIKDIYNAPTIKELSLLVEKSVLDESHIQVEEMVKEGLDIFRRSIEEDENQRSLLPKNFEDFYPVSEIQYGMIYHSLLHKGSALYHDQSTIRFTEENFDFELFKKAFSMMVDKHPIMRTSFHFSEFQEPLQILHKPAEEAVHVFYENISSLSAEKQFDYLEKFITGDRSNSFDISVPGLYRTFIFELASNDYLMLWVSHHAIMDGWSEASFKTELNNTYRRLKEDEKYQLSNLSATYKDFVISQLAYKQRSEVRDYWKNRFSEDDKTPLPLSKSVGLIENNTLSNQGFTLAESLTKQIKAFGEDYNYSLKDITLAAYLYIISLTTGKEEITIGLVANGRPEIQGGDQIIGCFLNTVPLKVNLGIYNTWAQLLEGTKDVYRELKSYDKLSFGEIINLQGGGFRKTQDSANPMFDLLFDFVDFHIYRNLEENQEEEKDSLFDRNEQLNTFFNCQISIEGSNINIGLGYLNDLYDGDEIQRIVEYYERTLEQLVCKSESEIDSDQILGVATINKLINLSEGDNQQNKVEEETLVSLFERQVLATPDSIALKFQNKEFTYTELNQKANQVAFYIRDNYSIVKGEYIGVMVDRSEMTIISILGVLKSGAAYLPLEESLPDIRINHIFNDAGINLLITNKAENIKHQNIELVDLSIVLSSGEQLANDNLIAKPHFEDNAYMIYTSGTTGDPKGVEVSHYNISKLLISAQNLFKLSPDDCWMLFHSITFDFSVWEIFGSLCSGGKLIVVDEFSRKDPGELSTILFNEKVTILNHVPSMFYLVANEIVEEEVSLDNLRVVFLGGEALNPAYLKSFQNCYPTTMLINIYGITETTVHTMFKNITMQDLEDGISNIGKALPCSSIYLMDNNSKLVPEGVIGEIVVGGSGVTKGYLNQVQLTKSKFIKNPYREDEIVYKSGDLGLMLKNGDIQYISRKDDQVKIRGYRIELQEIEINLLRYNEVSQSVVLVSYQNANIPEIIAYFTSDEQIYTGELKEFLAERIPSYMLPAHYIQVEEIPKTNNDKIDKKALLKIKPELSILDSVIIPPGSATEKGLLEIWVKVLGVSNLGVKNRFYDVGGNSLSAIQILYHVVSVFDIKIELKVLFENPNISELADEVDRLLWLHDSSGKENDEVEIII